LKPENQVSPENSTAPKQNKPVDINLPMPMPYIRESQDLVGKPPVSKKPEPDRAGD
jgi:hypothetical protein